MLMEALKQIKSAFVLLLILILVTGFIYPTVVTGIAQLLFPWKANGSLIKNNNQVVGSALIGQSFNSRNYFWGRPSATTPVPYNAASSSGSNMGPSNPAYLALVKERINLLQLSNPKPDRLIPVDLVTASGSGLDPDISPLAAYYQAPRVAAINHIPEAEIDALIQSVTQARTLGLLGDPRVNVLELNIALDHLKQAHESTAPH